MLNFHRPFRDEKTTVKVSMLFVSLIPNTVPIHFFHLKE